MAREWSPEIDLDMASADDVVCEQFPEFGAETPSFLGRGWDNYCILYPSGTAFRLPMRTSGAHAMLCETIVLPQLVGRLSLPIPQPTHFGCATEAYPYLFMGYRPVSGECADRAHLDPAEELDAAEVLGAFLRGLHALPTEDIDGLSMDTLGKADPRRLMQKIDRHLATLKDLSQEDREQVDRALEPCHRLAGWAIPSRKSVLIHGDLYPRHVMIEHGCVSGIIDWGDAHSGHPAVDLSVAFTMFGPEARERFWDVYGERLDQGDEAVARLRAGMYGIALLAYGLDQRDVACIDCGRRILGSFEA